MDLSGIRSSTVRLAGCHVRGQNELGMWSVWNIGASIDFLQVHARDAHGAGRRPGSTDPGSRRPACRRRDRACRRETPRLGDSVVRGRLPGARLAGRPGSSQNIWAAAAEAETQARNDRRTLQPAAGRRGRDHVAPAIDDIEMAGIAAPDRRLAAAGGVLALRRLGVRLGFGRRDEPAGKAGDLAGAKLARRAAAHQLRAASRLYLSSRSRLSGTSTKSGSP